MANHTTNIQILDAIAESLVDVDPKLAYVAESIRSAARDYDDLISTVTDLREALDDVQRDEHASLTTGERNR